MKRSTETTVAEPAVFVDTNVLLEATDEARSHHAIARRLLDTHPRLVFSAQVAREYLVVATRPAPPQANGLGLSLPAARSNLAEFRRAIRLLPEEKPILPLLLGLLEECPCTGKRIHDAHLAATAIVHRVKLLATFNSSDFAAFRPRVEPLTPAEVLATLRDRPAGR